MIRRTAQIQLSIRTVSPRPGPAASAAATAAAIFGSTGWPAATGW
ncbi:hypothetical protein [Streptomyces filipinensis]